MRADICIIGGGSAGGGAAFGALFTSTRSLSVVVVEKDRRLGGTSTNCGVNAWEPGIGGPGLHLLLRRALPLPEAGTGLTTHTCTAKEPYGLSVVDPDLPYEATLRRSGTPYERCTRFHFEPEAMAREMENVLRDRARGHSLFLRTGTCFLDAAAKGRSVTSARVYDAAEGSLETIEARVFIDASADLVLARPLGCRTTWGLESAEAFGEPSAPQDPSGAVNGVSLILRATPAEGASAPEPPAWTADTDAVSWAAGRRVAAINRYPNGDLNVNCLPTMDGEEFFRLSEHERWRICVARMYHLWAKYQRELGFGDYRIHSFAPGIGVRESHRLVGRWVLREQDLRAGYVAQERKERIVAYGDHSLDVHGSGAASGSLSRELRMPYGIPFDCLVPAELDNLLVACRGSSFTHIAASSCRLSRTMMGMGEAAGAAAAWSLETGKDPADADVAVVRSRLGLPRFEETIARSWGIARP